MTYYDLLKESLPASKRPLRLDHDITPFSAATTTARPHRSDTRHPSLLCLQHPLDNIRHLQSVFALLQLTLNPSKRLGQRMEALLNPFSLVLILAVALQLSFKSPILQLIDRPVQSVLTRMPTDQSVHVFRGIVRLSLFSHMRFRVQWLGVHLVAVFDEAHDHGVGSINDLHVGNGTGIPAGIENITRTRPRTGYLPAITGAGAGAGTGVWVRRDSALTGPALQIPANSQPPPALARATSPTQPQVEQTSNHHDTARRGDNTSTSKNGNWQGDDGDQDGDGGRRPSRSDSTPKSTPTTGTHDNDIAALQHRTTMTTMMDNDD
ncbi:hypothetical protein EDB89DRAFT_2084469 [Lactarius sanguifluus]|nr:hypothetical protein EDB89DRAFT_2084469 [Lactarius sanguifluus]